MSVPFYNNQANAVRPSPPFMSQQQHQQQQPLQQVAFRNQPMMDVNRRRSHNKIIRPDGSIEEADETEDDINIRDIATARYKRNHDYLNDIFNPNTTNTATTSTPIEQTKEELDQLSENYIKNRQEKHEKYVNKIQQIEQEEQDFWKLMNKLNDASTFETIESASKEFTASTGLKIQTMSGQVNEISIHEAMEH